MATAFDPKIAHKKMVTNPTAKEMSWFDGCGSVIRAPAFLVCNRTEMLFEKNRRVGIYNTEKNLASQ
jgi:hypothetical protein